MKASFSRSVLKCTELKGAKLVMSCSTRILPPEGRITTNFWELVAERYETQLPSAGLLLLTHTLRTPSNIPPGKLPEPH